MEVEVEGNKGTGAEEIKEIIGTELSVMKVDNEGEDKVVVVERS